MPLNLVRNSKVFFTTNVDANGKVGSTGFTGANTQEIQVLDGFSFSQNTNADTVTIMEAGASPVRGQRNFNTSLAPVDFAMSTYLRPKNAAGSITAEESVLWNALFGDQAISATPSSTLAAVTGVTYAFNNTTGTGTVTLAGTAITGTLPTIGDTVVIGGISTTTPAGQETFLNAAGIVKTAAVSGVTIELINPGKTAVTAVTFQTAGTIRLFKSAWAPTNAAFSYVSSSASDKHQLQKFGMLFIVDQVVYAVDNAAMNQVSVDFGLDAIATAAWTGQGTQLRQVATAATAIGGTFGGGTLTGTYTQKVTDAQYITNKLSTVSLTLVNSIKDSLGATQGAAGDVYTIAITGGSITINNNITYITPANLGTVNTPVTYYTGSRAITGTLNAYLRTGGTRDTGELLSDMLNAASATIEPMAALTINIGGANTVKVVLDMPATVISVPTVDVQQVVSTAINFTAQGMVPNTTVDGNTFDLTETNDIAIRYYA
jgi:hypothetical protein